MKLLQINTTVNSGSTGRIAEEIGKLAIDSEMDSFIAYGRGNRPSASKIIKIGNSADVFAHGIRTLLTDRHGFGSKIATERLILRIEQLQPDVIHLHNVHGYYVHIGLLFQYLSEIQIPVVWTLHDSWGYTGHCAFYESINCEKWKTECHNCPKIQAYPKSLFWDQSERNFRDKKALFSNINATIVTPSQWLGDEVRQSFLNQHPIKVIPNGIDIKQFSPQKNKPNHPIIKSSSFIILGVASIWDKRKGLDDFVQLHSLLSDEFQIVLIGLSKSQINSLPKSIIGIERTESVEELAQWYSLASVFVNPTFQDNFPTTNLEALACGTPVISYNTGGSPEAIDADTGIVVEKGDVQGLWNAIQQIHQMDQGSLRLKCRERAETHYNRDDRFGDYIQLYKELLTVGE